MAYKNVARITDGTERKKKTIGNIIRANRTFSSLTKEEKCNPGCPPARRFEVCAKRRFVERHGYVLLNLLLALRHPLAEPLDTTTLELLALLSGVHGMTLAAGFHGDFFHGTGNNEDGATRAARSLGVAVNLRMDTLFHRRSDCREQERDCKDFLSKLFL